MPRARTQFGSDICADTASELATLVTEHGLFPTEFKNLSPRAVATRLGVLAGRYVGVRFPLSRTRWAVFQRSEERKGNVYRVSVTLNATASSSQSCQTPSGSCDAAVIVYS